MTTEEFFTCRVTKRPHAWRVNDAEDVVCAQCQVAVGARTLADAVNVLLVELAAARRAGTATQDKSEGGT